MEFIFPNYVATLKNALKGRVAQETVISDLYGLVALAAKLDGKGDRTIDCPKSTGSDIMNRHANAHLEIQAHSHDLEVVEGIGRRFERKFKSRIHEAKFPHCLEQMHEMVAGADLQKDRKNLLLSVFKNPEPWDFLGLTYLEIVNIDFKLPDEDSANSSNLASSTRFANRPSVPAPEIVTQDEGAYIEALMDVYREQENNPEFDLIDLEDCPKHNRHFSSERSSYYAAEEVHRGERDSRSQNEQDEFSVLKDEIYSGIEMVYYAQHDSGRMRLDKVTAQAAVIPIQKSLLGRESNWIGTLEKRGVCHFLVNDKRLPGWVSTDE